MKAAILVGGLGTRLRPVVDDRPKPLAPVAGRPFLVYLLEWLRRAGLVDIVLCAGYRWRDIHAALGDGASLGLRLQYSVEDTPLGTAGALRHARPYLQETFIALNGDSYLEVDLRPLVRTHRRGRAQATLTLTQVPDTARYGAVETDARGRVVAFREKGVSGGPGWINAGVYALEPEVLDQIPPRRLVSLEQETFPGLVEAGGPVLGYPAQGYFVDIGTPESYHRVQTELGGAAV